MAAPRTDDANGGARPMIDGGNLKPLMRDIKEAADKTVKLKAERQKINDQMGAIREDLKAKGIPKKAFARALEFYQQDAEQREGYDDAYLICREAMGLPVQPDLFDDADDEEGEEDIRPRHVKANEKSKAEATPN